MFPLFMLCLCNRRERRENRFFRVASVAVLVGAAATRAAGSMPTPTDTDSSPSSTSREGLAKIADTASGAYRASHRIYSRRLPVEYSNGARTVTRITLPKGGFATIGEGGQLVFPDGTVVSKEFSYSIPSAAIDGSDGCDEGQVVEHEGRESESSSRCLIELRVLARRAGQWVPSVFTRRVGKWNEEPTGRALKLTLSGRDMEYAVPSTGDCFSCHAGSRSRPSFGPIGLSRLRLAKDEVSRLVGRASPSTRVDRPDDARQYLDTNCGYCHNPNGLAASSGLFLDSAETDPYRLGACKTPLAFSAGAGSLRFDVVPGDPGRSLLIFRMSSLDARVAMPEIGRSLVDADGVRLVAAWIRNLKGDCGNGA